ncbi:MAG: UDP-N-acetylglucosamine 2-epimerase (non-hydrolyzing) [Defluviitaleaceae bacterium]|nr:UDP-N-acetylglucosamine 2-epimerase (non-hydrolyzing) [Defluviitaleaceae bacterium]
MDKIRILSIFGTRPEATKMASLVKTLEACSSVDSMVCVTAQHRHMLDQVLTTLNITPDYDLDIMVQNQDLAHITTAALNGLLGVIKETAPHLILAHGDTTTTLAAGLAAYYAGVKLGHVEAGLRTYDKFAPYPEEVNRRIAAVLADINFAPTAGAKVNLLAENVNEDSIYVTGNTAIDLISGIVRADYVFKEPRLSDINFAGKRVIAMTAHRRENYGLPLENICKAVKRLVEDFDDVHVVYPVHLSPAVRNVVFDMLGNNDKISLIDPIDWEDALNMMARSYMIMTDSGGLQEEAPHLNRPVIVLRDVTERPEGLATGCLALAGTEEAAIYDFGAKLLTDPALYAKMAAARNPFGDGQASSRILAAILHHFGHTRDRPIDFA